MKTLVILALILFASAAQAATGKPAHMPKTLAAIQGIEHQLQATNAQLAALNAREAAVAQQALANQATLIGLRQVEVAEEVRVKNLPTDFGPPAGGGVNIGTWPYGPTCAVARARMRWSDMPCAWDMPER